MDVNGGGGRARSYCNSITSEFERNSLLSAESITESRDDQQDNDTNSSAAQAAKAVDIAGGNDTWVPSTPSRPASLATTTTSEIYAADERQVLLTAGPPPPDYAEATAREENVARRLVDEESLYTGLDDISSVDLSRHPWKPHLWRGSVNRGWKSICLLSLIVYCILTAVILAVRSKAQQSATTKLGLFPPDHPVKNRDRPQLFHESTAQCHFDSFSEFNYFLWLDPAEFAFIDTVQESDYEEFGNVSISGRVEVRPAPYGQNSPIEVITNFATTSTWRAGIPKWEKPTSPMLRIYSSPSHDNAHSETAHSDLRRSMPDGGACLDIWVGIYIKTQLDNFTLHTESMDIDIGTSPAYERGRWSFRIRDNGRLYSESGNVTASYWDSRIAHVTSERGSITGTYGLNENLTLETQSGDITATVWQEAPHEQGYLSSHPPNTPAYLSTITTSGDQNLQIWQGLNGLYWAGLLGYGYPYLLSSSHYSQTGSVTLQIGYLWEGKVHATSVNGSIDLRGKELELLPNPPDLIPVEDKSKHLWARKGGFDGRTEIDTPGGNISLCVGEEWDCLAI